MAAALAHRDMGTVVRLFRKWTGASQTSVGAVVGMPQPAVSDLEHGGRRIVTLELFERFAEGLGIPRHLLGLAGKSEASSPKQNGVNYRAMDVDEKTAASHRRWLAVRRQLGLHRPELTRLARGLYPPDVQLGETGMLIAPEWRLPAPIELSAVELAWQEQTPPPTVTGREAETRPMRPLNSADQRYSTYHRAVRDLDKPRLFENRLCYRLLGVDRSPDSGALRLTLRSMCYFDMIDVGEALAHEIALNTHDTAGRLRPEYATWQRLPFRRLLRDPFDLSAYPLMLSVSTLTVRRSKAGSTFYLLRRNPSKVAIAGGMLSVFPTGVFQPASVLPAPNSPDFDLWRNVMREYSEEFLGNPEHDGDGPPIDYENEEPFRSLEAARAEGRLNVYCLGVGIDALNYVGDVLTVAIFDADVFDHIFGAMVQQNDEGDVDSEQYALDAGVMARLLAAQPVAPSGAACIRLAAGWFVRS